MSLLRRVRKLEAASDRASVGTIAFWDIRHADGPVFYDGEEFPSLEAAQASCGEKILCLLPCKLELADWIEAMKCYNNLTPATAGN